MNRYTFKAKRKDKPSEWIYGYYIKSKYEDKHYITEGTNEIGIRNFENGANIYTCLMYEIIPETLCQCTGLQDRDGNYIFENDIVINHCHYKALVKFGEYEYLGLKHYGFYIQDIEFNDVFNLWGTGCKIIENKFDKEVE